METERLPENELTKAGLTQELSETLIPTLREAAAASMCPTLGDATRMRPLR
ncbi:hypothetical protein [Nostoc sp.]|uniref:hypothetical protein n=1 Tax=Nostoc sp. TaxID=1180 RepID=UPI002FFA82E9